MTNEKIAEISIMIEEELSSGLELALNMFVPAVNDNEIITSVSLFDASEISQCLRIVDYSASATEKTALIRI